MYTAEPYAWLAVRLCNGIRSSNRRRNVWFYRRPRDHRNYHNIDYVKTLAVHFRRTFPGIHRLPDDKVEGAREKAGIMKAYSTTLLLTLSNPMTILSFIALFASMSDGMVGDQGQYSMWSMVTGIFLGSAVWWLGLSGFSSAFKTRMSESRLKLINYFSGSTITVLAAYQVVVGIMLVIEV